MQKIIFILLFTFSFHSLAKDFSFGVAGRMRHESATNYDLTTNENDFKAYTLSRFRISGEWKADDYKVFIQPQFSRTWGQDVDGSSASGSLNDPPSSVHQAFIEFPMLSDGPDLFFKLGRQEFAYGDELVIGSVGWNNVGRSFDGAKLIWKVLDSSQLDIFSSKLKDNNISSSGVGDKDFSGLYFSGKNLVSYLNETDVYYLALNDSTSTPNSDISAYGFRVKSSQGMIDYRTEFTFENVNSENENQMDIELGLKTDVAGRFSINYFSASDGYNQLFPTGHKWLGLADGFSRKNIKGYQLKQMMSWNEWFKTDIAYYQFQRTDDSAPAYSFSGAALGSSALSSDTNLASEVDLVLNFKSSEFLDYQIGGAMLTPGTYFKDNGITKKYEFIYFQISLKM